jgi:hypothetical protein
MFGRDSLERIHTFGENGMYETNREVETPDSVRSLHIDFR